jgi:hypothetical protein
MSQTLLDAALGRMEEIEYASLVWGSVDGGFDRTHLSTTFMPLLEAEGHDDPVEGTEELIEELIDRALICECRTFSGKSVFRSRFAEGVRLLVRLRQMFPMRNWRNAPLLVSDYRVDLRPRRYPLRDQCPRKVRENISEKKSFTPTMTAIWDKLVPPNGTFMLAGFQARAADSILSSNNWGTIITAGTGSGKTLAFYLPVLTKISEIVESGRTWTKCLAVYPRVELLKDQFSESLAMCARIKESLVIQGRRPITVGTLFMGTPQNAEKVKVNWQRVEGLAGFVCPYSHCTAKNSDSRACNGDLVWFENDLKQGRERLVCRECGSTIEEESIVLTRQRALRTPPDILFTTLEMLHKRLADPLYGPLLGVDVPPQHKVSYMLLDEVHTYTGLAGAQGAMVIRRWKHASGSCPIFVGLSATLLEARQFFHELTGIPNFRIETVGAMEHEMFDEGAEYQLVIKGNPASQTSLLSTSIQTCMLMSRLQDPPNASGESAISDGRYGRRVFAFTDDLDVNTRLYDDLRDAEGIKIFGQHNIPLAALRGPKTQETLPRDLDGQRWRLPEMIGHRLDHPLVVGRTSSRDPGVARKQNLIVATASLEVGYNDPEVGAVLQHKAPKDFASFLQRKGRAGRMRTMRPWTLTVLTAFGRDRLAFQSYHQLFEPVINEQHLPIRNLYLVRMQSLGAFFDWLSLKWRSQGHRQGWPWRALSTPDLAHWSPEFCKFTLACIDDFLADCSGQLQTLTQYIKLALDLTDDEVESVLYSAPRSLMLEALPTLKRRLETKWQLIGDAKNLISGLDINEDYLPLPEFIAPNLFSQLALPEVNIEIINKKGSEFLPITRALREVVPGRVTRRFAEHDARLSHWVPLDAKTLLDDYKANDKRRLVLTYQVSSFVESTPLDRFPLPGESDIMVYSPFLMRLTPLYQGGRQKPRVSNTSNARPIWHSHIFAAEAPQRHTPSLRSKWHWIVSSIDCHTHANRSPITVRRYATGAEASLRIDGESVAAQISYVDQENVPVGLGIEFETDGIVLRYRLPMSEQLAQFPITKELQALLRHAFYRNTVVNDKILGDTLNSFQLEWIQRIYLAAVIAWASVEGISLEEAHTKVRKCKGILPFERAMKVILGFQEQIEEGGEAPPLFQELTEVFCNPGVLERLHNLGKVLYSPSPPRYFIWLRERLHESMALSVYDACVQNVPLNTTMSTLLVDSAPLDPDSESAVIWITEDTLGGSGVIETLSVLIAENPGILFKGIEASLAPTDLELNALILEQVVHAVVADNELSGHTQDMRNAVHHQDRKLCMDRLSESLQTHGIYLSQSAFVSLNARLLRPGTQPAVDSLIVDLLNYWDLLQGQFGIIVGLQEFCSLVALDCKFQDRIQAILPSDAQLNSRDVAAQLYGILWPRQHEVRQQSDFYHPFRDYHTFNEPKLIHELLLKNTYTDVTLCDANWRSQVLDALGRSENCRLISPKDNPAALAKAVAEMLLSPVDIDYLQFYPVVERYEQGVNYHAAIITIWEDI